jgi:hypothetical protein
VSKLALASPVLDAVELVALRMAAGGRIGAERDDQAVGGILVGGRIDAFAAVDRVVAGAARELVVAFPAKEHVGAIVALEFIAMIRPGEVIDMVELIALGIAARGRFANEGDAHALVRVGVGRRIDAFCTFQVVGAPAALERVVVVAAEEGVVAAESLELVVAVPAPEHVLEIVAP